MAVVETAGTAPTTDGGRRAYYGFAYQIDVSVWLLLEGLFRRAADGKAEIETSYDDDLALFLSGPTRATNEYLVTATVAGPAEHWVFAIKTRQADHWTYSELLEIVDGPKPRPLKGKKGRPPPIAATPARSGRPYPRATLAADPAARFVFVTEGAVAADLSSLLANAKTWRPQGGGTAAQLKTLFDLRDRIAVFGGIRHETLEAVVDRLLAIQLGVPVSRCASARSELRSRVEAGVLDKAAGTVTRKEIVDIAVSHGGWPRTERRPLFVEPANWPALAARLDRRHRLVILGEPGTGKSEAAEELVRELCTRQPPFRLIEATSPRDVPRRGPAAEPVVVWADDPFGKYAPHPPALCAAWLDAFGKAEVGSDYKLVVNARRSFALDVQKSNDLSDAVVSLDDAFADRRSELLRRHLASVEIEPSLRGIVERPKVSARIAQRLSRPESFRVFARELSRCTSLSITGLEALLVASDNADLETEMAAYLGEQSVAIRRGAYVVGWLLSFSALADPLKATVRECQRALDAAGIVDVDAITACDRLADRGWLARRSGRGELALRDAHLKACVELAHDDQARAGQVAVVLAGAFAREYEAVPARALLAEIAADFVDPSDTLVMVVRATMTAPHPADVVHMRAWKRPAWDDEQIRRARSDARTEPYLRGLVASGLLLEGWVSTAEQARLVDFMWELGDVREVLLSAGGHEFGERFVGQGLDGLAHGYVRATGDPAQVAQHAATRHAEIEKEWSGHSEDPDEDSNAAMDHMIDGWHQATAWPRALAEAVLRLNGLCFAVGRGNGVLWVKLVELLRPVEKVDVDDETLAAIVANCPDEFLLGLCGSLAERGLSDAVLAVVERLPSESVGRSLWHRIDGGADETLRDRCEELIAARLRGGNGVERVRYAREVLGTRAPALTVLEIDEAAAMNVLQDPVRCHPRLIAQARPVLEALVSAQGVDAGRATVALARVDSVWVAGLISCVRSPHAAVASDVLDAAELFETTTRLALIRAGMAHRGADARKAAVNASRGMVEADIRASVASIARADPTPSVRIVAIRALSVIRDGLAFETAAALLKDDTDTSEDARHGVGSDERAVYGVANAARALLDDGGWPDLGRPKAGST